jgi:beta-lactam-binding protein with PASTA domain
MNEARNVTATFTKNPSRPEAKCRVPKLRGKSLAKAKRALSAAHCSLGRVKKPKGKGKLLVGASRPGAGTVRPAGARVNVKLTRKH